MYLYDPEEFEFYKERWVAAADSTIKHLASSPTTREDIVFLADHEDTNIVPRSSHREFSSPTSSFTKWKSY